MKHTVIIIFFLLQILLFVGLNVGNILDKKTQANIF